MSYHSLIVVTNIRVPDYNIVSVTFRISDVSVILI